MTCPQCGRSIAGDVHFCTSCGAPLTSQGEASTPALSRLALGGVVIVILMTCGIIGILYLLPPEHLRIADPHQVVLVAPAAEFAEGTSRLVLWGEHPVLVVRRAADVYHALEAVGSDGCYLSWDEGARHVVSPCTHIVYDLRGNVIAGLTTEPLARFRVFLRAGMVYVTEANGDG